MIVDLNYCYRVARNIIILLLSILGVFIGFKFAIFYMPFLVAFIISIMIEPIIKFIMKKTKLKRRTSSIIVFIIALGIIIGIITLAITSLITETSEIMTNFNEYAETVYNMTQNFMQSFDFKKLKIPENVIQTVQNSMNELLQTATVWTKGALSGVINFITSIPTIGICTMVTLLALYFICVDKIYMIDQIEHHLPETWVKKIGVHLRDLIKTLCNLITWVIYISLYGIKCRRSVFDCFINWVCRCTANIWFWNCNDSMGSIYSIYGRFKISTCNIYFMDNNVYCKTIYRT